MRPETADEAGRRTEPRFGMVRPVRPFLASRIQDLDCFPYEVVNLSSGGVGFRTDRPPAGLAAGDTVCFHLPFRLQEQCYDAGPVRWVQGGGAGVAGGVKLERRMPLEYPLFLEFETGEVRFQQKPGWGRREVAAHLLRDCLHLKKGIRIYFEHVVPYFTHVARARDDAERKRQRELVSQVNGGLDRSLATLVRLLEGAGGTDILSAGGLDEVAAAVRPEIDLEPFLGSFEPGRAAPYLHSIKCLEHRLFANHNSLVLLASTG